MRPVFLTGLVVIFCLLSCFSRANNNGAFLDDDMSKHATAGLYIDGSRKFKLRVLRHLQRLTNYRLDIQFLSGKVIIYGISYEGRQKEFGNKLIKQMVYANEQVTIKYARDKQNRFVANSHTRMVFQKPVGGTIYYHPKNPLGGINIFNKKRRPPHVGLAHELIHSWHAVTATACMAKVDSECLGYDHKLTLEEHHTRLKENKIRKELGIAPRQIPITSFQCLGNEMLDKNLEILFGQLAR